MSNVIDESIQRHHGTGLEADSASTTDHSRLMDAGWSYRMDDRGWIIYHDFKTGRYCVREDALGILNDLAVEVVARPTTVSIPTRFVPKTNHDVRVI